MSAIDNGIIIAGDHAEAIQTCFFGQVVLRQTVQLDARWKSAGMHCASCTPVIGRPRMFQPSALFPFGGDLGWDSLTTSLF